MKENDSVTIICSHCKAKVDAEIIKVDSRCREKKFFERVEFWDIDVNEITECPNCQNLELLSRSTLAGQNEKSDNKTS